ncbi:C45 family autoproteolytic acyltransferase/hydolase [Streptosporangium sp. NPDC051022]|uniref:C45 family autoproteolytic acyltransferase/hydolase n=1 Tax=Streptosporangium sp. NPDC051022 TaxID=3155752 RepID=UPI0034341789
MADVVAGGPEDFMIVRHLTVEGGQREIGRALAEEAGAVSGWRPPAAPDAGVNAARMAWFARNWPQHHARLGGIAEAFGADPVKTRLDGLPGLPGGSGCSVVWCPAPSGTDGHARVGRNYDFFILSADQLFRVMAGQDPVASDEPPMASRPYVITTVPDDGPASTVITMNEFDGCMEGVNEAGLSVALLIADAEAAQAPSAAGPRVGLNEVQLPRFLLDTCENAGQAERALREAEQYTLGVDCHYLVADPSGRAFVWERGPDGAQYVVDAGQGPMCVTNHLLHRHPDVFALPEDNKHSFKTYGRARALAERTHAGAVSGRGLRDALDAVAFDTANGVEGDEPWRTLWRSVFDLDGRTMATRFYLGDGRDGARHSEEIVFTAGR